MVQWTNLLHWKDSFISDSHTPSTSGSYGRKVDRPAVRPNTEFLKVSTDRIVSIFAAFNKCTYSVIIVLPMHFRLL